MHLNAILLFFAAMVARKGINSSTGTFHVEFGKNSSYNIGIGNKLWLSSSAPKFSEDGDLFSALDMSLKAAASPVQSNGVDQLGPFTTWKLVYVAHKTKIELSMQYYQKLNLIVFNQHFPDGLSNCSTGDANKVLSQFPSFNILPNTSLGVLAFGDLMSGWVQLTVQSWKTDMQKLPDGLRSGPLVLFDQSNNVMIVSAMNHFTANSYYHDNSSNTVGWGIMGRVDSVPKGYTLKTLLYHSDEGINDAMYSWGQILQKYYNRPSHARTSDLTVNYIGYYTDNGGYYYHHTEENKNYEETFKSIIEYYSNLGIPYRYLQYDDFWYYIERTKTDYGATTTWEPLPGVFPHGLEYIFEMSNLPVLAHNRYWSYQTSYAKQNGGAFDFLIDKKSGYALPLTEDFWDYLFSKSMEWGLINYEQDWMNTQFEQIDGLQTNISLAETWLKQMGRAAERYNMKLQYCMALPREILQTLEIPAVTQARASGDYVSEAQWKIGMTSMFLHAVGIAPFKDNFWTTPIQPGNPYNRTELNVQREAIIALLSTGPVGVSDSVNYTNMTIINRLIRQDGLLLKPSKPATAVNTQIWQRAFGGSIGPKGEVYTAFSMIPPLLSGIVFASELMEPYKLTPTTAGFDSLFGKSELVYYEWEDVTDPEPQVYPFSSDSPLPLTHCANYSVCLHYVAQVFHIGTSHKVAILGELSKYVPISPQRINSVTVSDDDVVLEIKGMSGEVVFMYFWVNKVQLQVTCQIGSTMKATLSLAKMGCAAV